MATTVEVTPMEIDPAETDEGHAGSDYQLPSLVIPIRNNDLFIEIFPEEISSTSVSTLMTVLKEEKADWNVWADAAWLYVTQKQTREAVTILEEACQQQEAGVIESNKATKLRLLASAGIAHLAAAGRQSETARQQAEQKLTQATKVENISPITWVGRGMYNMAAGVLEQARFFFETTHKHCGPVLPALLGLAAVAFGEGNYNSAQQQYAEAIRRYPQKSGASARVGFGLCCYKLGQVDRAKAAFARALDLDPECVEAMVGSAVLDMAGLDASSKEFQSKTEKAIKMMSMANLLDHSNAMVQNHLANHYFWKWTPAAGTVEVTQGSTLVKASQAIPLDPGEPIRIGTSFETIVKEDPALDDEEDSTHFRIQKPWKDPSTNGLKLWKKDYERVHALAKGAYNSTSVQAIQAESLFFLARVYHAREDIDNAHKFYDKACKLASDLTPAHFGLAQTLIVKEKYDEAIECLKKLLSQSGMATDAMALLGLLLARSPSTLEEGLSHLRKAIQLDPFNEELVTLEALALQQNRETYGKALERYKKAIELLERKDEKAPYEVYTNCGVLSHETKSFEEALEMYRLAFDALDENGTHRIASLENRGIEGGRLMRDENDMFFDYVDSEVDGELSDGTKHVKVAKNEVFQVGDRIRLGSNVLSEIVSIESNDAGVMLELKNPIDEAPDSARIFVLRENSLLTIPEAISIAFNIARLHEVTGRTTAAIEIHKAIAKRNPAYVNSYLRLACIAVDSGALNECAQWLKIAAAAAPGNPEVLTLIGNLHLSLCDWKPAQNVFDGLMAKRIASAEAYSALSMGNIFFSTLHVNEERYTKHLQYASDYYKRILSKDPLNAYAANGLGTVLAERAELFKAKEVFNRVREVSGDAIADALLNLGHIYLAQKKHPEALQMYRSYLKKAEDGSTPITSKSRAADVVEVLQYIAFAYFDWARHTELFNDAKAAPADDRYKEAMHYLELAIGKEPKKDIVLKYNLAMTKLQAGNCVLQKLTRNIPRTVEEVENALHSLEESLEVVKGILQDKENGEKIDIRSSTLEEFVTHCEANIASAKSHLEDERRRKVEEEAEQALRRQAAEIAMKEEEIKKKIKEAEEAKAQEERDRKAELKMRHVQQLQENWQQEQAAKLAEKEVKSRKKDVSDFIVEEDPEGHHGLFDDSDDEGGANGDATNADSGKDQRNASLFDDSDEDEQVGGESNPSKTDDQKEGAKEEAKRPAEQDLFGDSDDDESDEELIQPGMKRENESAGDENNQTKKRRLLEGDDED